MNANNIELPFGTELSLNSMEANLSRLYSECGFEDITTMNVRDINSTSGKGDNSLFDLYFKNKDKDITFDLSKTRYFHIDCLLFVLCVMNFLKRQGFRVLIFLPELNGKWDYDSFVDMSEEKAVRKARDFLVRWKFHVALKEAMGCISEVLLPHQKGYFDADNIFYTEKVDYDQYGNISNYLSSLLVEISHMTRGSLGIKYVSEDVIRGFLDDLAIEKRFINFACMAITKGDDNYFMQEFASSILWESLINTEEHPHASLSMIAAARDKRNNNLIIAISDNGEPIPETINEILKNDKNRNSYLKRIHVEPIDEKILSSIIIKDECKPHYLNIYKKNAAALHYSTEKGTSSKKTSPVKKYTTSSGVAIQRGMGLYYVKSRTLQFRGSLTIRSGNALVKYYIKDDRITSDTQLVSYWPGNLVTIQLPMMQ